MSMSTQLNLKKLEEYLICPVLLEPLTLAVSLVPCAHKVQQSVAEQIFGNVEGWLVTSDKPCPVCRVSVVGYMADHSTRNLVQFFELPENQMSDMIAKMKTNSLEKSLKIEKDVVTPVQYPGKPAKFVPAAGNWELCNSGTSLCRYMKFKSSTNESLLEAFSLLGYRNGDVSICIKFSPNSNNVKEYLKQYDLIQSSFGPEDSYLSMNKYELTTLFTIIASNNEIPEFHFHMIRDIVEKGKHN